MSSDFTTRSDAPDPKLVEEHRAIEDLKAIVADFNASFARWRQQFGMVSNFSWSYDQNDYNEPSKKLEVASIDRIVYRRPAPTAETLQNALREMPMSS